MSSPSVGPSVSVGHPLPFEEFPVGVDFLVSGIAVGTGVAEPLPIASVTVRVAPGSPVNVDLIRSPHGAIAFSAIVRLDGPGEHQVVVTATDDIGRSMTEVVPVTTPGFPHCRADVLWINYPQTLSFIPYSTCRAESLTDVVSIVRRAEAANKQVHASGSKWSFSDCALTGDYVIDTRPLHRAIQTVQRALRPGQSPLIYHVEAGITIQDLYNDLSGLGFALETMGGASGQTLAGAISTGTHGGDKSRPPLADSVLAIHLVGAGGTQYWIEPSSGITDPALLQEFVAPDVDLQNIVYDDTMFDACLVSLGCMGVIYAVVLRVREPYDLVETTVSTTWQALQKNPSKYLNDPDNRFLQVIVSPYRDINRDNLCLVTTRSEADPTSPVERSNSAVVEAVVNMVGSMDFWAKVTLNHHGVFDSAGLPPEQRLAKIVSGILVYTPDQRHVLVEHYGNIMRAVWPETLRGSSYSVMDIGYKQERPAFEPGYSFELFFPSVDENGRLRFASFIDAVIDAIEGSIETFFAGYISLRFTGPTRAYLGMQQWDQTCAVEVSIVRDVPGALELITTLFRIGYERGGLPHWGQMLDLGVQGHGSLYPQYLRWRQIYGTMSHNFTARAFENGLSSRWNLTTPNDAQFISQTVSQAMEAGRSQSVTVTMRNTGVSTWNSSTYSLGSQDPPDNVVWGLSRQPVPADVLPGATVTFHFEIIAPRTPGGYVVQWRMLQEPAAWFGQLTPREGIGVDPPQGRTLVPDVIGSNSTDAADTIRAANLEPAFTGNTGLDAWVSTQSPTANKEVAVGSTVTLHMRTGPQP